MTIRSGSNVTSPIREVHNQPCLGCPLLAHSQMKQLQQLLVRPFVPFANPTLGFTIVSLGNFCCFALQKPIGKSQNNNCWVGISLILITGDLKLLNPRFERWNQDLRDANMGKTWKNRAKNPPESDSLSSQKLMFHGHPPRVPFSTYALFTPMLFIFDEVNVCIENSTQNVARS